MMGKWALNKFEESFVFLNTEPLINYRKSSWRGLDIIAGPNIVDPFSTRKYGSL